jgi:hypothetical protein
MKDQTQPKEIEDMTTDEAIAYMQEYQVELRKTRKSAYYRAGAGTTNVGVAPQRNGTMVLRVNNQAFGW